MTWILASDQLRQITLPQYWLLIGQDRSCRPEYWILIGHYLQVPECRDYYGDQDFDPRTLANQGFDTGSRVRTEPEYMLTSDWSI